MIKRWSFVELLSVPLHKIESCDRANDPINGSNLQPSFKVANKLYNVKARDLLDRIYTVITASFNVDI